MEDQEMHRDAVAEALSFFERTFERCGRWLDHDDFESPGAADARDDLEQAMLHLPPGAKRDLGRLVARIDAELERRTLPEPYGEWWPEWMAMHWWRARVREH
ncbi:hypothetical protein [Streptomyces sp. NBC_00102]|uniref:hypothetical protein n=1 Tax=Streptomyces sp. NBC_00102 TaxID=2975652 RepID=UPI002259F1CE|nr:hypothetical protein [Streptomyces sp. NBC_00102]MCX5397732.1 hypothetical protein [Streptomyces sp. NBC_00102]